MSTVSAPAATTTKQVPFGISSETGRLRRVIVHTPGAEMDQVDPDERLDLLFDDILFVDQASDEHQLMCALFEHVVGEQGAVLQIRELLNDVFRKEAARRDFIGQLCRAAPGRNLHVVEEDLEQLTPPELTRFVMTGQSPLTVNVPPLPNLMFTRDLAAVVGEHVVMSHAATAARARESMVIEVVLRHHEAFAEMENRLITLPEGVTFEGGDLLVADPEVVLIGHSERTSLSGAMAAAEALFEQTPTEHVLVVDLPKKRSCMHLDTVFTFVSPGECVVYPPLVSAESAGTVLHLTPGDGPDQFRTAVRRSLKETLEQLLDRSLTFIPCGGPDRLSQQREQWTDGANLFAAAPGLVVGYERNVRTFEALRERGYRPVEVRSFLNDFAGADAEPDGKIAVKLEGQELSRGRGGPRCMTLPLARQAPER
jgi:arginine deiminase